MLNAIDNGLSFKGVRFTCVDPRTNARKFITQVANGPLKASIDSLEKQGINFDFCRCNDRKNIDLFMIHDSGDAIQFVHGKPFIVVKSVEDAQKLLTEGIKKANEFIEKNLKK